MSEKYYYIKQDSGITGPFSAYQIIEIINSGILSEDVMISENRIYWNSAANILLPKKQKKDNEPRTVALKLKPLETEPPQPAAQKTETASPIVLKDDEKAVPFILPETSPAIPKTIFVPDPVSVTFSMVWNAPRYLKNMEQIINYDNLHPNERNSEAVKYSARTAMLCVLTEFIMTMTLCGILLRQYFIAILIAILLIMICQAFLIFLENLCMAAIAHKKKLFEPSVLIMQLQLAAFTAFMAALPLGALTADTQNSTHIAWKIIAYIFCFAAAVAGMTNMSCGLFRAMTDIFNFQTTSKISLIMLNILQWLLLTAAIFKLTTILTMIL